MKYTQEIELKLPRARVIELFDNPDNLTKWQPELISFKHESGQPGHPGAKSRLKYKMGKRDFDLVETIIRRNLPDEFSGSYEMKGVLNIVQNRFIEAGHNKTQWVCDNEFQFQGIGMKLMSWFLPGMFRKQSFKFMEQFKSFAEKNG